MNELTSLNVSVEVSVEGTTWKIQGRYVDCIALQNESTSHNGTAMENSGELSGLFCTGE